jgi:thiamine kinase-like enzyme
MDKQKINKEIIFKIEKELKIKIIETQIPPQGMDSEVFIITDSDRNNYVIKSGKGVLSDIEALKLLKKNKIDIPTPELYGSFRYKNKPFIILQKINFPLLEKVHKDKMYRYIPSMVKNLRKIHKIKSNKAGYLVEKNISNDWKEILLSKFLGKDKNLNWKTIVNRPVLDKQLILKSIDKILFKIKKTSFIKNSYSFLHIDFNQRNLFIDPSSDEIGSIIDWGESMFGDPIYDFARIRMYIWHFHLGNEVLKNYYKLMSYTTKEKSLEELYWLIRIIEYLAYYSQVPNRFNLRRIKLHQDFLRNYRW